MQDSVLVVCPTCCQEFEVAPPALHEVPTTWDYDCEICCRPMTILFEEQDDEVVGWAESLDDL